VRRYRALAPRDIRVGEAYLALQPVGITEEDRQHRPEVVTRSTDAAIITAPDGKTLCSAAYTSPPNATKRPRDDLG
jgi:hypothetical protein